METAKIPTAKCQEPKMDPHYAAAVERAREAAPAAGGWNHRGFGTSNPQGSAA